MELLFEQYFYNENEEPNAECTPEEEKEEIVEVPDYDYDKRLWF